MSPEEEAKADEIYNAIIGTERNSLVARYGNQAERIAKGRAIKQAQKLAEKKMNSSKNKLREIVKTVLSQPVSEKKGRDMDSDSDIDSQDYLAARDAAIKKAMKKEPMKQAAKDAKLKKGKMEEGPEDMYWSEYVKSLVNDISINGLGDYTTFSEDDFVADYEDYIGNKLMSEDLDLGHEDNEPHMLKKDLYRIGKYAMELYQMVDQFEGMGEVDFPHWWQSKVIKAKEMMSSAKHYLDFELKEPEIDAMVGVASAEDMIGEESSKEFWVVEKPNGQTVKYFGSADEAKAWISKNDPEGMVDYNLRQVEDEIEEGIHDRDITSAPHTNVKGDMEDYNPAKRAASLKRLANFGPKKNDDEIEETLAQRIAKKLKEDVVKGSNIKKDSKGKWRVLSGKTGKMWPQTYDSKADAEDALQAYHATKG